MCSTWWNFYDVPKARGESLRGCSGSDSLFLPFLSDLISFVFPTITLFQGWKPGEEPDVAAAIMGLFHLLPHSPKFLDQLVKLTLQLEAVLHRYAKKSRGEIMA